MKPKSETEKRDRQDWGIVLLILLIGFCCVGVAGQWALRLSPSWKLDSDVGSGIDPYRDFQTKPVQYFEPVEAGILTQPAWVKVFLTPGAKFVTGTPPPTGQQANNVPTHATTSVPLTAISVTVAAPTTAVPTNTFTWVPVPATNTPKPKKPKPPTDTPIPPPSSPEANLAITNFDDAVFYDAGSVRRYTIEVSNLAGPDGVTGATISNSFAGGPVSNVDWTCSASGTVCPVGNGSGMIVQVVDLPLGSSITYTVDVTANAPTGNLEHTASVSLPGGYLGPSPVNAVDTNTLLAEDPVPPAGIGTVGLPLTALPADGSSIVLRINADIDDNPDWDLAYYEEPQAPGILMDKIIFEVSDGKDWYPLFNWGDNASNGDTNLVNSPCGDESDNCPVDTLPGGNQILINIPAGIPNVTGHFYIRITVPLPGPGDDLDARLDAIIPL